MLDYWQLQRNPFRSPGEFFLAGRCEEALARLTFLVEQGRRCGAVTGLSQIGKSRLLRELRTIADRPNTALVAVDATALDRTDFAVELVRACGAGSSRAPWDQIIDLLHGWRAAGISSLWLIDQFDDAIEDPERDVLRLIRTFDHTEAAGTVILGINSFMEQSRLHETIDLSVALEPWNSAECGEFIQQRLEAAGRNRILFSHDGLEAAAECSGGIPGTLVRLCDLALHAGWTLGVAAIDAELVVNVSSELIDSTRDFRSPEIAIAGSLHSTR